jgi:NADH-quinone oxidoreductase subunit E
MEKEEIQKIVNRHRHEKASILAILHEVQQKDKHLGMESLRTIALLLKVPFANVYGLATFYSAFSTRRKGDSVIRVCDGISCHLNGADEVIETLKAQLNVEMGETTWDEKASLEKVHCLGLCSIGPNISFNEQTYTKLDKEKVLEILQERVGGTK